MLTLVHSVAWDTLCGCSLLLAGVVLGKYLGVHQGKRLAALKTPLYLRKQLYDSGQCPVCDTAFFADDTMEEKGVVEHEYKSDLGRTAEKYGVG